MSEPLKNKRTIEMTTAEYVGRLVTDIPYELKKGCGPVLKLHKEEDIKSAVEWLKEKINNQSTTRGEAYIVLMKLIEEAFEDVIEK